MIWLAVIAYVLAAAVAHRLMSGHIAWRRAELERLSSPTFEQRFDGAALALVPAAAWPLALTWVVVGQRWAMGAEAASVRRRRAACIRQLEEELL